MIELRNRILKSGQVILEYRRLESVWKESWFPRHIGYKWTGWDTVPYVDEDGNPMQIDEKTGRIDHA